MNSSNIYFCLFVEPGQLTKERWFPVTRIEIFRNKCFLSAEIKVFAANDHETTVMWNVLCRSHHRLLDVTREVNRSPALVGRTHWRVCDPFYRDSICFGVGFGVCDSKVLSVVANMWRITVPFQLCIHSWSTAVRKFIFAEGKIPFAVRILHFTAE